MVSIEERAEEFADAMVKGALGTRNDYYDSYIKGAIDQRKINIEKTCDWIEENLFTVNENGEYKYVAKNIYGSPYIKKDLFRDFCKAMEDQQ